MVLWTSDKYITSIKKLTLSQKHTLDHGGSAQTTIRTNMHICVPVLIQCRITGLKWVLSSYIPNAWVGKSKKNTRGVGISQEKSRINPSMGQLMVEGGIPNGKVTPSLQHLMADKRQGLL